MRTPLNPLMYHPTEYPLYLKSAGKYGIIMPAADYAIRGRASGGAGGTVGRADGQAGGQGGAGETGEEFNARFTLDSACYATVVIGAAGLRADVGGNGGGSGGRGGRYNAGGDGVDLTNGAGGGGAQPTYLHISCPTSYFVCAWTNETRTIYTINEKAQIGEIVYDSNANKIANWRAKTVAANDTLVITDGSTTETYTRNRTSDTRLTIAGGLIYMNGGAGGGGGGCGSGSGRYSGGAGSGGGGGFYRLDPITLTTESVAGKAGMGGGGGYAPTGRAGQAGNTDNFPQVYSGAGAGSAGGGGAGASGGGASGGGGGYGSGNHSSAHGSGGGGGAGGSDKAGGGQGGYGKYQGGTAYNYHTTAPTTTDYTGATSTLGKGGDTGQNGNVGYAYIIRFAQIIAYANLGVLYEEDTPEYFEDWGDLSPAATTEDLGGLDTIPGETVDCGHLFRKLDGEDIDCGSITDVVGRIENMGTIA